MTLAIGQGSIEPIRRATDPSPPIIGLHGERMLRYELRSAAGEIHAAGAVPDPRAPRAEWADIDGEVRGSVRPMNLGEAAAVVVRLPEIAGELVVFEETDRGTRELGRPFLDPSAPSLVDVERPEHAGPVRGPEGRGGSTTIDILFVSEGYTAGELAAFERDVDSLVAAVAARPDLAPTWDRVRVLRQAVTSRDSGVDDPAKAIEVDTAFDVAFAEDGRCPWPRTTRGHALAQRLGSDAGADLVVIVANSEIPGGCAAGLVTVTRGTGAILSHELGHALAGLADEYDAGRDEHACLTPGRPHPNISPRAELGRLPWRDLVTTTSLPTPTNAGGSGDGVIGAYEGGDRCGTGRYRPEHTCLMRELGAPLCAVCRQALADLVEVVGAGGVPSPAPLSCAMVERSAGPERFATAAALSRRRFPDGAEVAVLVSGEDTSPDGLVAGPLAHHLGGPVLLTSAASLPGPTADELSRLGVGRIVMVGGPTAISAEVEAALRALGVEVVRLAGQSRFATAAAVAREIGDASGMAYIVSGEDASRVDVLSAAGPAGALGAPVLLVTSGTVPAETEAALRALGVVQTIVVGGPAVVSDAVLELLPDPVRIAGADRFGTSVRVARDARARGVDAREVLLARADRFADAVAAGAAGQIILLASPETMPEETRAFLSDHVDRVLMLGGEAALGHAVEAEACIALCGAEGGCLEGCGNGVCDGDETDATCARDCGCAAPGSCGSVAPFGCHCDADCALTGDCCADVSSSCGPVEITATYGAGEHRKAIDKDSGYAYAPAIMYYEGLYHLWACDLSTQAYGDSIGYTTSPDGITWTPVTIALEVPISLAPAITHACDPSVVRFQPPGDSQTYFYLFYSSLVEHPTPLTFNAVARSLSPAGPFAVFIGGDPADPANWKAPLDRPPHPIQVAAFPCPSGICYGAGQPSVVVREGTLHMWYFDSTYSTIHANQLRYTTSRDGIVWEPSIATVNAGSADVKFDEATGRYLMIDLVDDHDRDVRLVSRTSSDGIIWVGEREVGRGGSADLPDWIHNVGISGDERGFLLGDRGLVGFGAPYDLRDDYDNSCTGRPPEACWASWDLYVAPLLLTRE